MNRNDLVASAAGLRPPTAEAAAEYAALRDKLAAEMNRMMAERPDVLRLVGEKNLPMMEDNHRNHARFIATLLAHFDPAMLADTVLWVFRAYRSHGFTLAYWPAQLDTWVELLRKELSPAAFASVYPVYEWMIVNQPAFAALSEKAPEGEVPAH